MARQFLETWTWLVSFVKRIILFLPLQNISMLPQAWTLVIEMQRSLLIPFLILLVSRNTVWLILFVSTLIWLFGVNIFIIHFALGIIIAKYFDNLQKLLLHRFFAKTLLLVIAVFFTQSGIQFHIIGQKISDLVIKHFGCLMALAQLW